MNNYEKLKQIIQDSSSIVVFTGAGISVPSGIPDVRSAHGLYSEKYNSVYSPEEIISHHFFYQNTDEFYQFYKSKMMYLDAKPNLAHQYFADLEKNTNKQISIVTQNIDGLHQLAGSKRVYELHGSIHRNYCENCHSFYDAKFVKNSYQDTPTCPKCGGIIKPDVVLYEEGLDEDIVTRAIAAIQTCDTLIVIGTSLVVYPAASFVRYYRGHNLILINKDATQYDDYADLVFHEDVIKVIKAIKEDK
jgi:NAD-dependent deacetylase